jgi:pteridine reductase
MNDPEPQRVALVTGGAVRVGRALSLGLAKAGYDLLITYWSSASEAHDVAARVREVGRRCELVQGDLSRAETADSVVEVVGGAYGRLDLLVNSAGSFDATPLLEVDAARWDAVMALNARAPHLLVRAAAELLRRARGCVVNIADLSAFQPWLERPHHAVSKAALVHLTKVQARALAPDIRVNAVVPGVVLPPEELGEPVLRTLADATPLRRIGSPEDVLEAVLYLARAEFVTGEILVVDGGSRLGTPKR